MIKNKDGSYNKFRLTIVILISIISMFIVGSVIVSNIDIPKIEIPTPVLFKETPTPTITSTVDPSLFSNVTYDNQSTNNKSWLGETYEVGRYASSGGGAGGYAYPRNVTNATFIVIAGGGGGAGSYASSVGEVGGSGGSGYIVYNYTAVNYNSTNYVGYNFTESNTPTSWNWSFSDGNYSTSQEPVFLINQTSINQTAENVASNFTAILSSGLKISDVYIPLILVVPLLIGFSLFIRNRSSMIGVAVITIFLFYMSMIPFVFFTMIMVGVTFMMLTDIFNSSDEIYR